MSRLIELLSSAPRLLVSLPRNDRELAKAALDGGAEALKVHLNVHHDASGTHFGTLTEERKSLEAILRLAGHVPVGVVTGSERVASRREVHSLREMGVDFFDLYAHHMPAWMIRLSEFGRMVAINSSYPLSMIQALVGIGMEILEAAVVAHEGYGKPLNVQDLASYRLLRGAVSVPIVVPSQRKLTPEDAQILTKNIGIEGIMIGAIVTGKEPASLRHATERFQRALAK